MDCIKSHGLIGTDLMSVDSTQLLNAVNVRSFETGTLKNYKVSIKIKRNVTPSYFQSRRLPIHIKPMVIEKLNKMVEGIVQHVDPGGNCCRKET